MKEKLKLWKEIKRIKYLKFSVTSRHNLTENKVYDVYGICLIKGGLYYLIKEDDNRIVDCPISWFEVIE